MCALLWIVRDSDEDSSFFTVNVLSLLVTWKLDLCVCPAF